MKQLFIIIAFLLFSGSIYTQSLLNPSLEGSPFQSTPGNNATLPGWSNCCYGILTTACADVLPFVPVNTPPTNGSTYGAFSTVSGNVGSEGWCQTIALPVGTYALSVDVMIPSQAGANSDGQLEVWVGTGVCNCATMVWRGPTLTASPSFQTQQISFSLLVPRTQICFRMFTHSTAAVCFGAIDNLSIGSILEYSIMDYPTIPDQEEVPISVRYFDLSGRETEFGQLKVSQYKYEVKRELIIR